MTGLFLTAVIVYSNVTKAEVSTLSLDILSWAISCTSPTSIYVGSTGASFAQRVLPSSDAWVGNAFSCTDLRGTDTGWDLQLQGDDTDFLDIDGSADATKRIDRSNVNVAVGTSQDSAGACSHASQGGTLDNTINLLSKTGTMGEICTIDFVNATGDVDVTVTIPANMAVGAYQGTMTVTYPL